MHMALLAMGYDARRSQDALYVEDFPLGKASQVCPLN
jgi:hypothetical protein